MPHKGKSLTRRDFIRGTLGATVGTSLIGTKWLKASGNAAGSSLVAVVRDKGAMDASNNVNPSVLKTMLDQTLIKLTGKDSTKDAWLSLVKPIDTIGLVPTPHL
ncbi:MAG: hypothetical protein GTO24_04655, partial [candidate division Zixibacteria bacterium]|nr:hypothetical protein [candidate division Zixibacteria bacterium]